MSNKLISLLAITLCTFGLHSTAKAEENIPEMLLYCGITMVKPMTALAKEFEKTHKVKIKISQGGSEDLAQSMIKSQKGDWYLPGEPSYIEKYKPNNVFANTTLIGYNQLVLVTAKDNPKNIKGIKDFTRNDIFVAIGNSDSGSVGKAAKDVLTKLNIYDKVVQNSAFLASDSRSLIKSMVDGEADLTLSWRASTYTDIAKSKLSIQPLDKNIYPPQKLILATLKYSSNPSLATEFVNFVQGDNGSSVFKNHGFLDKDEKSN